MSAAKIKLAQKLKLKKYRSEFGLFIAEGLRLCEMALHSNIEFGFYTAEFIKDGRSARLINQLESVTRLYEVSAATFDKLSDTKTPQGIMLIIRQRLSTCAEVVNKHLIVALDGVHDPGNVGTILRTAEAFDCGVILLDDAADVFNPKVVRASMGAIFNLPVAEMSRADFLALMAANGIEVLAAALDDSAEIYYEHDFTKKSAVVFGSEADGVSDEVLLTAKKIFIPMSGRAESLNVAVAASIIIAESARQKLVTSN